VLPGVSHVNVALPNGTARKVYTKTLKLVNVLISMNVVEFQTFVPWERVLTLSEVIDVNAVLEGITTKINSNAQTGMNAKLTNIFASSVNASISKDRSNVNAIKDLLHRMVTNDASKNGFSVNVI